jgi:hypothetical protein
LFKIYFVNSAYEKNQVLMYDDTRDDDELKLGNPKLHIEVNAAGTLDFELPPTNVAYSKIIPMVTEFHVIKDNQKTHDKRIWFGRVLTIDTDLYGIKTVHCEGGLSYLNDCIYYDKTVDMGSWSAQKTVGRAMFVRYESPTLNESGVHVYGVSPQEASAVIANIMSGGSNYKENLNTPFKHLGRIAKYTDPDSNVPVYAWVNEPVIPSGDNNDEDYYFDEGKLNSTVQKQCGISNPNNMTAIDLISSMMSNAGGLFWVSKTPQYPKQTFGGADLGDAVYVMQLHMRRYYPAFNPREGQTIRLGENLTDLTITDDGTTFFTAVHPHGQHVDGGEDFTLDQRGLQSGTTYINKRNWKIDPGHGVMYCPELVERYGMIIRDLDVGTTNIYEQLVGMGMSEIDKIPLISRTVDGSWTSGVRELTVKGIDLSLYNVDYSSIELTDAVRVLAPRHGIDTYLNATAIDYDLQNVENTVFTLNAIKTANEITDASPSYGSNSISPSIGSSYVHPKHTEHDLGLYKFSNDNLGHVDSAVAATKKDITALGIPGENTKYYVSSSRNPDAHGVTLTDSQNKTTIAPLETYRRTLPLNSYSNDGEYVEGRGYLIYTTGFQIKSEYGRFDATHPLNLEGRYTLTSDGVDHKWSVNGDVTANGNTVILNLKTDTSDSDLSINVYAYGHFEEAVDGHEYILYHVWLAIYLSKNLTGLEYTTATLSSIQYTDFEGLYLQSPPDSDHAIDYSKLVKQTESAAGDNIKYELSKTGNTITLTGSDGTSSRVTDSDTKYQLVGYYNRILTDGPVVALEDPNRARSIVSVPNTFTSPETNIQFAIGRYANIGDGYKAILDLAFFAPNSFGYGMGTDISGYRDYPVIINSYITLHFGESSTKRFLVQIITSARSDMAIVPARAIVRQLDSDSAYSNTKWKVFLGYTDDTARKGLVTAIRICLPSDTCSDVTGIESKTFTYLATSIDGDLIERPRVEINTYDIVTTEIDTILELSSQNASDVAFAGDYNDLSNKPVIPDISGKQDKTTAVTHSANTAVGSATKPVYVAANGAATPISHSINSDVPANAKFTDTTYGDATQSTHGLMTAADKKKLDGLDASRFMNLNNSALVIYGAGGTAQWYRLGTLVSSGNFNTAIIRILSGDGANGHAQQNSSFEIHIKDAWQSTETVSAKACGVTVYRINCANAEVKVIPTAHDTYTVWVYLPWGYWNGDYAVYGKYKSWTSQRLTQPDEPEGTGADTAYYDQAFLTSTVAKSTESTTLTDSGWVTCPLAVTGNTTYPTSASTIRVRKYGKMVKLEGWVKYAKAFNDGHNVATIPDGYRPESRIILIGVPSIGSGTKVLFYVGISAKGNIGFSPADSAGSATFNPAMSYDFQASYFID